MYRKKDRLQSGETERKGKPARRDQDEIKTACWSGDAHRRVLGPRLESPVLPWRKRSLPGGGLGIVINIIDTPVGQLSLFPSGKQKPREGSQDTSV